MNKFGWGMVVGLAGGALLLIVLPIGGLVWRSVQHPAWDFGEGVGEALLLSLWTTFVSLCVIVLTGTPLAYLLSRWQFRGKRAVNVLIELPIVLPPAVAGLGLLVTFGKRGLLGGVLADFHLQLAFSTAGVVLAQTFVALPFYTRSAQVGFSTINPEIEEAAAVDGASQLGVFIFVTVPLASRALVSGLLLSWARALGEFGATIIFAGSLAGETRTMPLLVYYLIEYDLQAAIRAALILVFLAVGVMGFTTLLSRDKKFER